ncbi:MAG: hypothetical protein ACTHMP_16955 [Thermomicrobiales bacterium]
MSVYADNPIDLQQLMWEVGTPCQYRRAFASSADPGQWIGPGPVVTTRPTTTRDSAYDPVENAVLDSTVDAGTGYTGAYAPAVTVNVLILATTMASAVRYAAYGIQLDEFHIEAVILASEMTPARGDLIIHPNGQRYVVSEEQHRLGVQDAELGYHVILERRNPGDIAYSV